MDKEEVFGAWIGTVCEEGRNLAKTVRVFGVPEIEYVTKRCLPQASQSVLKGAYKVVAFILQSYTGFESETGFVSKPFTLNHEARQLAET
jgi:hypothetical protein